MMRKNMRWTQVQMIEVKPVRQMLKKMMENLAKAEAT